MSELHFLALVDASGLVRQVDVACDTCCADRLAVSQSTDFTPGAGEPVACRYVEVLHSERLAALREALDAYAADFSQAVCGFHGLDPADLALLRASLSVVATVAEWRI